jgi:Nucleotidyl transferase AbiEii toxin, Type IV TA system
VSRGADTTRLLDTLRLVGHALDEGGHPWALVDGLAISVRLEPRFTRDIDLAVAVPDDHTAERIVSDLAAIGFTLLLSLEQHALGRLAAVRLLPPGEPEQGIVVDLLFSSSGIEPRICNEAERVEIAPGLIVPVAQAGHLIAMKLLAVAPDRPQDAIDLRALMKDLSAEERERAVTAVGDIERMGAHRGKSLSTELERWLGEER